MKVVIDPGHGGADPGAVGNGLKECDITLKLGYLVAKELAGYAGAETRLTRQADQTVSLEKRVALANDWGADLFVSLHVNAGGGTGYETHIHPAAGVRTLKIATHVHSEVATFYDYRGFANRGLKKSNFYVLRSTRMPALLLENLFIDSLRDAQALKDADFLRDAARAIAGGIAAAFGLERKLTGMERLKRAGLVLGEHAPEDAVTWDEFQTVMNRLLDRCESCRQQGGCGA